MLHYGEKSPPPISDSFLSGRQSVRNLKTIPILSAEFLESRNEELRFDDMEPSKFDQIASINGLGDILDEKELDLIKKLRNISGPGTTVDEVRDHFGKDVRKLLDMAGFAGINEEVHPEEYMFKRSEKDFMKIGAAAGMRFVWCFGSYPLPFVKPFLRLVTPYSFLRFPVNRNCNASAKRLGSTQTNNPNLSCG